MGKYKYELFIPWVDIARTVNPFKQSHYETCQGILVEAFIRKYKKFPLSFDNKDVEVNRVSEGYILKFNNVVTRELS